VTLEQAIRQGEARLSAGPHPDRARRDAEALLLHVIRRTRAAMLARWKEVLEESEARVLKVLIERRFAGEPMQYIVGETEFYGLPFHVTPDVLIPRPETEHLVEEALRAAARFTAPRIVDIGTGSGAIAVALAHLLARQADADLKGNCFTDTAGIDPVLKGHGFSRADKANTMNGALAPEGPSFSVTAIDISPQALALAEQNANRNGAAIRFLLGDLLAPVAGETFDLILSNPPYVPIADRPTLSVEVREFEPSLALFAGDDGLNIYRRLIPEAHAMLAPCGLLLLEIGFGQKPAIGGLLEEAGFREIKFVPDLQGIPRVVSARRYHAPPG
jgi:release factor glutamine methyltransferase